MTKRTTRENLNNEMEISNISHIEARTTRVETQIVSLTESLQSLAQSVKDMGQGIERSIGGLHSKIESMGKTDWGRIIGFTSVVLVIIGIIGGSIGSGYLRDMTRLEREVSLSTERDYAQQERRGRIAQQIEDLNKGTAKLDIDLQREMRDVNATTEAKIVALDTKLQRETSLLNLSIEEKVKRLAEQAKDTEEYQISARELHGRQNEMLNQLEKRLEKVEKSDKDNCSTKPSMK